MAAALPLWAGAQSAGRDVVLEVSTGSAWSLRLPLVIELPGGRTKHTARYETRPFADSPYYSVRLGIARESDAGVEAELLHHKLYLTNPRPPIERLEISHGYNLAFANLVRPAGVWHMRFGVGLVVAHAEGRIGGREIRAGYQTTGPTIQFAMGRRYPLSRGGVSFIVGPEAKLTASWARVRLEPGNLLAPNIALHLLGGLGVRRRV